jgi:hypothetical protein
VSKNSKRIISILISFSLFAFAINRYIAVQINNHYYPESQTEYWIIYPIVLSSIAVYFIVCAFKGKFILWGNRAG